MPAIGAGSGKSAAAEKKVKRPAVKVKAPSKPVVARAKAQQQQYVSQGKAVEKTANSQRKVRQAKQQQAAYVDQGKAVSKAAVDQKRTARIKYLRKTRPTGLKLIGNIAESAVKGAVIPNTGAGPDLGKTLTPYRHGGGLATAMAPKPVTVGKGVGGKLALNLAKDAITFPAQAISSTYDVGAGVVEAAQGKPKRIKNTFKAFKQTDPIYNTVAAGVEAVQGHSKAAGSHIGKAGKALTEHPGLTLLEAAGVKGGVGRSAGKVMRSGVTGKTAKRAASTQRTPRQVPNTNIEQQRVYSRDVITKGAQVVTERTRRRLAARKTRQAVQAEAQGHTERAAGLRQQAAARNPDRLPASEIKRQVDERVAVNEDLRRYHRAQVTGNVRKVLKPAKREGAAVSVVAQRITTASKTDLAKYVGELKTEFPKLTPSQKRANKTLRQELMKVVNDPKADMSVVHRVAGEYEKLTAPLQKVLVSRGLLEKGQAEKANVIPYAVRNMGAKHDAKPSAPRAMQQRYDLAQGLASAEQRNASTARGMLRREQTVASKAQRVVLGHPAPRKRVTVRQTGVRAPFEISLPRRPLSTTEKAAVTQRLDAFKSQSRAAVRSAKGTVAGREKLAKTAAAQAKKAKPKKYVPGIVGPDGEPLTLADINAHMAAHGVGKPAFITQAPNQRGARNFNIRAEKAQAISTRRRTGAATVQGTLDAHPETLVEGAARSQGLVDATQGFRQTIKDFGHRSNGKLNTFKTYDQARQAAADAMHDQHGNPVVGAHAFRPVRLNPVGANKQQLDNLLNEVDTLDHGHAEHIIGGMRDALQGKPGPGKWALIPDVAAQHLLEHLNAQGGGGTIKTLQVANQAFRNTVLATSPTWFAGNLIEGLGRAALEHAGPRSYVHGKRVLSRLEQISPKAAEEAMSRIVSGGHYASADKTLIHRGAEQFAGTYMAPLATALGKLWRTPGPKQAAWVWHHWTTWVFHTVNGAAESKIQTAMLGRSLLTAGQRAVDDAAKGLTGTPAQIRFGREVDRMYGRYSKRSPSERKFFSTYTPFAPWAINATYFVYRTLPRDHPVAAGVIAAAEQATQEWRKQHGLDQFMGKGALPPFLQGSIPLTGGGHLRAARFTPFGAFGSPSETLGGQVLPLWSGALAYLRGEDWKGKKLTVKDGTSTRDANELERFVFAARALAEATVPIYSTAARVKAGGLPALNPFKVVKSKKATTGGRVRANPWAGTSGNPWSSGSGSNPWGP